MVDTKETPPTARSSRWLDLHLTLPFFRKPLFLVLVLGPDRRQPHTLLEIDERRNVPPLAMAITVFAIVAFFMVAGTLMMLAFLYLLKMWAGIDLVKGSSPIPNLLRALRFCH